MLTTERHDLVRLLGEHDALEQIVADLVAALEAAPRDLARIVQLRSQLAIVLHEHLSKEDGVLYDDCLRGQEGEFELRLGKFHSEFASLTADWQIYLEEWPADVIACDIEHFSDITLHLMGRLRERIRQENALLYPLALQQSRITLRAL